MFRCRLCIAEREGGFVFNAGTVGWAFGLHDQIEVQIMIRNLLRRASDTPAGVYWIRAGPQIERVVIVPSR